MSSAAGEPRRLEEIADLYENAPCGNLLTSVDGLVLRANATFLALTGYRSEELVGRLRFDELLTPGGRIYYETHLRPLLHMQGQIREVAVELVCADGGRLPTMINSVIRPDPAGGPARMLTVVVDATERHGYERELLVANRRIERLQRVTATFASALDARQVADATLNELVDGVKADHGVLALLGSSGEELEVVGIVAESDELADAWHGLLIADAAPVEEAIRTGSPVFVEQGDGRESGVPALAVRGSLSSRLAVIPLTADERVVGVLCLASCSLTLFKGDERRFLVSFARLCAQALERGRLQELADLAAKRERLLSRLGQELDERISFQERAQCLVDLLVPDFADFAAVEVPVRGPRPVAARHSDPALLEALLDLRESANAAEQRPRAMLPGGATGQAQLLAEIPERLYGDDAQDEGGVAFLRRLAPRSYLSLPLLARGQITGSLTLVMSDSSRRYGREELPFFLDVAKRAGVALENARLYEHEHGVAHRLQRSLLPSSLPADARIRVEARYRPSTDMMDIGGDWYDAFALSRDRLGFAVGDVVGHNVEAAIVMGQVSTALRAFALDGGGPASVISRLSRFSASVPGALCTTLAYAELDLETGILTYSCAGHLPPIVFGAGVEAHGLWEGRSPPLGAAPDAEVPEASIRIDDKMTVLLITDGLIERRGPSIEQSLAGLLERLTVYARTPLTDDFPDDLIGSLFGPEQQEDDICLLSVSLYRAQASSQGSAELGVLRDDEAYH